MIASVAAIPQKASTDKPNGAPSVERSSKVLASLPLPTVAFEKVPAPAAEAYAIAGAPDEDYDTNGVGYLKNSGSAFIYEQDVKGEWNRTQKIVAGDRAKGDLFGWSAAISGDYAVVSAPHADHDAVGESKAMNAGAAYIFEREPSGKWIEIQKIFAADRKPNARFGYSVSIAENFIIVGAHAAAKDAKRLKHEPIAGAAYLFEKNEFGKWKEVQKIVAEEAREGVGFGYQVSIFENLAIVSTADKNIDASSSKALSNVAYIFERNRQGIWVKQQKVLNPKQTLLGLEKLY